MHIKKYTGTKLDFSLDTIPVYITRLCTLDINYIDCVWKRTFVRVISLELVDFLGKKVWKKYRSWLTSDYNNMRYVFPHHESLIQLTIYDFYMDCYLILYNG